MIIIYLCDDNGPLRASYKKLIQQTAKKNGEIVTVREFSSGDSLLFSLQDDPNEADIIYLDIVMPGTDGIETAKKLRANGCTSEFIFLTSNPAFVFDSFDVSPVYYILKNNTDSRQFTAALMRAVQRVKNKKTAYFTCKHGKIGKRIPISSILYFEIANRIVTVHYNDDTFDFYSNMATLEKKLADEPFIRTHRSFLVNLNAIDSVSLNELVLVNGEDLPVGRTYCQDVQEALSKHLSTMI